MAVPDRSSPDFQLAVQVAKLWPHRQHESNLLLSQCCRLGLHRWRRLDLEALGIRRDIVYCFRCSKIKIEETVHDP